MNCERTVSIRDLDCRCGWGRAAKPHFPRATSYPRVLFAVLVTVMLAAWLGPKGYCDESDKLIRQVLKRSGMASQVKEMVPAMVAAFPGDAFSQSNLKRRVQRRVETALGDEALLDMVRDAVREDFDHAKLEMVLSFYESKLGRKVGHLQARSLTAFALSGVREGRKALALMPDVRRALYEKIVRVQQVSHTQGKLFESMIAGLAAGSYGSHEDRSRAAQQKLKPMIGRAVSGGEIFKQTAVAALARTFRSLSDEELTELATFEESDAAQWFRRATQPGLAKVVYAIGHSLGAELQEARSANGGKKR